MPPKGTSEEIIMDHHHMSEMENDAASASGGGGDAVMRPEKIIPNLESNQELSSVKEKSLVVNDNDELAVAAAAAAVVVEEDDKAGLVEEKKEDVSVLTVSEVKENVGCDPERSSEGEEEEGEACDEEDEDYEDESEEESEDESEEEKEEEDEEIDVMALLAKTQNRVREIKTKAAEDEAAAIEKAKKEEEERAREAAELAAFEEAKAAALEGHESDFELDEDDFVEDQEEVIVEEEEVVEEGDEVVFFSEDMKKRTTEGEEDDGTSKDVTPTDKNGEEGEDGLLQDVDIGSAPPSSPKQEEDSSSISSSHSSSSHQDSPKQVDDSSSTSSSQTPYMSASSRLKSGGRAVNAELYALLNYSKRRLATGTIPSRKNAGSARKESSTGVPATPVPSSAVGADGEIKSPLVPLADDEEIGSDSEEEEVDESEERRGEVEDELVEDGSGPRRRRTRRIDGENEEDLLADDNASGDGGDTQDDDDLLEWDELGDEEVCYGPALSDAAREYGSAILSAVGGPDEDYTDEEINAGLGEDFEGKDPLTVQTQPSSSMSSALPSSPFSVVQSIQVPTVQVPSSIHELSQNAENAKKSLADGIGMFRGLVSNNEGEKNEEEEIVLMDGVKKKSNPVTDSDTESLDSSRDGSGGSVGTSSTFSRGASSRSLPTGANAFVQSVRDAQNKKGRGRFGRRGFFSSFRKQRKNDREDEGPIFMDWSGKKMSISAPLPPFSVSSPSSPNKNKSKRGKGDGNRLGSRIKAAFKDLKETCDKIDEANKQRWEEETQGSASKTINTRKKEMIIGV